MFEKLIGNKDAKDFLNNAVKSNIVSNSYMFVGTSGIGKKILSEVFELAKNDNMKNLQILTDESCSYYIYESLGCKKVYETIVENKEYGKLGSVSTEKAYIYEKVL